MVKLRSRWFTALNLLPSIATSVSAKRSRLGQHHELMTGATDHFAVVFTEPGNPPEVRRQAAREPHQLNVVTRLTFKATDRMKNPGVSSTVRASFATGGNRRPYRPSSTAATA